MWLKLHDNNGPIFINMDNVTHFQRVEGKKRTTLTFATNSVTSATLQVQEPPDEIMDMLWEEE